MTDPIPPEERVTVPRGAVEGPTRLTDGLPAPDRDAAPTQIGPYRILETLGEGGFGVVYLAKQSAPVRRNVALKIIKRGMDSKQILARFDAEKQALALMNHAGVAKVLDAGTTDAGLPYFVMEHVAGMAITEYCDRNKLSIDERLDLFVKSCEAVQHAHQKGVIHRDIKPSNILVSSADGAAAPKVIDFGIAKALSAQLTEETVFTEHGQVIGTPEFMSPEQARGAVQDIDTRADVYSLGVLLYELLIGQMPLDLGGIGFLEVQRRIQEVDPPRPSTRLSGVRDATHEQAVRRRTDAKSMLRRIRGDLDWIVMKCLEKNRARRYETASALAEDIRRHLRNEPVLAGPPSASYVIGKFVRRHRLAVAATAVVFSLLVAGIVVTSVLLVRAVRAEARADAEADAANQARAVAVDEKKRADREAAEATKAHAIADAALTRVLSLSDVKLVADYAAEAEDLWPAHPEMIEDIDAWLKKTRALGERLPGHEAELVALRRRAIPRTPEEEALEIWRFSDAAEQWQHDVLAELVGRLRAITALETGTIASVEERLVFAHTIEERTVSGPDARAAWAAAIESISDRDVCPLYGGLVITPQIGLLPLDRNPQTGLWEFWHIQSGARPAPDPKWPQDAVNRWIVTEDTGLVLVLVPGGSFRMGAEPPLLGVDTEETPEGLAVIAVNAGTLAERMGIRDGDVVQAIDGAAIDDGPALAGALRHVLSGAAVTAVVLRNGVELELTATASRGIDSPNVDPDAQINESPILEITLDPFFLSKYEMTQGQWKRFVGENPSEFAAGDTEANQKITLTNPVENVSWNDVDRALGSLALLLPTESQWEYACRAGTTSTWYTGREPSTLTGHANICDEEAARFFSRWDREEGYFDGFVVHSPVASLAPNPFGLHDMHGNLWEWCRDEFTTYDTPPRPGDGLRVDPSATSRVFRSGSFYSAAASARSAVRLTGTPANRNGNQGVRPSRGIGQ